MDQTTSSHSYERREVFEFDTIEALDVLVSPLRLHLLDCFAEPATVKQAAERIGVQVTRLYHHVNRLVDHGFVVVVAERPKGKTVERVYGAAARSIRPSPSFFDRYGTDGNAELMRLSFRTVESEVVASAESDPSLHPSGERSDLSVSRLHLSESDLRELVRDVKDLRDRYRSKKRGEIEVSFFTSVIPLTIEHPRKQR